MSDPFGIHAPSQRTAPAPASGGFPQLLLGIMVGAAILLLAQRGCDFDFGFDGERDDQQQTQPVDGKTLIFLHERNPQSIEHDMLLREMKDFCASVGLDGFRALDDDLTDAPVPQLIQWAQTKGVSPPLVILTNEDDQPFKAASFPSTLDDLKAFVK